MAQSTAQELLWNFVSRRISKERDTANKVGPYKISASDIIYRHFDCTNYPACLDVAAIRDDPSAFAAFIAASALSAMAPPISCALSLTLPAALDRAAVTPLPLLIPLSSSTKTTAGRRGDCLRTCRNTLL